MFSWRDMKDTLRELEDPEVKNAFQTVVIDTVDIAGGYCEKYICNQNGVTRINEIPYGRNLAA